MYNRHLFDVMISRSIAVVVVLGVTSGGLLSQAGGPKEGVSVGGPAIKAASPSAADKKAQEDWQRTVRILEAIGFGLICGSLSGYLLGRARSPKFDDPTDSPPLIRSYVAEHCQFEPDQTSTFISSAEDCIVRRDRKGVLKSLGPRGIYVFPCGIDAYTYDPKRHYIEKVPASVETDSKVWRRPRKGFEFKETLAIIAGGAEGYSLKAAGAFLLDKSTDAAKNNDSLKMLLFACLGAISGFVYGFWLGYTREPRCGDKLFQQLLNDPVFWEGVAAIHDKSQWWSFSRDRWGIHVVERGIAKPSVNAPPNCPQTPMKAPPIPASMEDFFQADPTLVAFERSRVSFLLDNLNQDLGKFGSPDEELTKLLVLIGESSMVEALRAQVGKSNGLEEFMRGSWGLR